MTFNERLWKSIQESGISISDLVRLSGVSRTHFYNVKNGGGITVDKFIAICDVLGIPTSYILDTVPRHDIGSLLLHLITNDETLPCDTRRVLVASVEAAYEGGGK